MERSKTEIRSARYIEFSRYDRHFRIYMYHDEIMRVYFMTHVLRYGSRYVPVIGKIQPKLYFSVDPWYCPTRDMMVP